MTIKLLLKTKPCKSFTIIEQPISITPAKSVTLSKKARLALLVNQHIAEDPYEFEDFQWAAIVQPDLASLPKEGILCVGVGQLTNIELDAIEKGNEGKPGGLCRARFLL